MPLENCLACASDEGIFLDTEKQPALIDKIKNCRLDKISEKNFSTKVCYKCAFEIEQCNIFVEKVKKASKIHNLKKACCILCLDVYNSDAFFDLSKQEVGVDALLQQIEDLFTQDLKNKNIEKQFICLACRYFVDLLTDLRNLSNEVPDKLKVILKNGINAADLPKTKTSIINRKTTFLQTSNLDLNTPSDTDSDSSSIMNSRKKMNKMKKSVVAKSQRKCEECKSEIENGIQMYRIFRTGRTICKDCWLTIDPGKAPSKKRKKIDYSSTKLCSVLLKDVYQRDPNDHIDYKIEKDDKGNVLFIVTDDSETESKINLNKIEPSEPAEITNETEKPQNDLKDEELKSKPNSRKRKEPEQCNDPDQGSMEVDIKSTRVGRKRKDSEQSLSQEIELKSTRGRPRKTPIKVSVKVDPKSTKTDKKQKVSESSFQEVEIKSARSTRTKRESIQSVQEDFEIKSAGSSRTRKESEQSYKENLETKPLRSSRKRNESEQSTQDEIEVKSIKSSRSKKEQSVKEIKSKPTRATRNRKESDSSVLEEVEIETRSTRSSRNRKDSEQSLQEIVKNSKEFKGKDSEQSAQEDIEINVDVDSDSAPTFKKAKKSSVEPETIPKQSKSKAINQNNAPETILAGKRGRSSSIESTGSIKKSSRSAKKNHVHDLEEIIEIDDNSDSSKIPKEKDFITEDVNSETEKSESTKIISSDEAVINDENSDAELNIAEVKVHSKISSSLSSKESTPIPTFKTPSNKNQENANLESVKRMEIKKPETIELDRSDSPKLYEIVDTSESEEIDILKSTDEETKEEDTILIRKVEKTSVTTLPSKEISEEHQNSKSDKDIPNESADKDISIEEENLKQTDENLDLENDNEQNEINSENLKSTVDESSKLKETENESNIEGSKSEEQDNLKKANEDTLDIEVQEKSNEQSIEKDIDSKRNLIENEKDVSLTESVTNDKAATSNQLQHLVKSRKSKSLGKRKSKRSIDEIVIYDSSDSESIKKLEHKVEKIYTCPICDKTFESKYIGLQHELSHMKTLELKLHKVEINKNNKVCNDSDSDSEVNKLKTVNSDEIVIENENKIEKDKEDVNDLEVNNTDDLKEISNENIEVDVAEINKKVECDQLNEDEKIDNKKDNELMDKDDATEENIQNNKLNELENDIEISNESSPKQSCRKTEEKRDRKSRGRRKITDNVEPIQDTSTAIECDSDKIAEAVQETLNDMAVLHGKIQESALVEIPKLDTTEENQIESQKDDSNVSNVNENETEITKTENKVKSVDDKENDFIKSKNEEIETSLSSNDHSENERVENTDNLEAESTLSKEVIDIEIEKTKQTEESEVEITEIDDDGSRTPKHTFNKECEEVDLTEHDEHEAPTVNDDDDIEVVTNSKKNIKEDENTVNCGTEINVTASDVSSTEKNDENQKRTNSDEDGVIEDDGNNTEEEEALAQESLEELLQRKGLQVIDEFAESVTDDGDEESEKDVNVSSEKENGQSKPAEVESELEIKISDNECTEILAISNRSTKKQKEVDIGVVGEKQITQDVDVVEEVINDGDQPQSDVVQEVEVESNGNCLDVANNVVGEVLTEVFNMAPMGVEKHLDMQTEPISDDETEILPRSLDSRKIRNSHDMPSLDPICEDIDDE